MPNVRTINAGPSTVIHHIGSISHGGPFAWPSLAWVRQGGGNHRFDDPRGEQAQFTVLYGASEVEACFAELLDQFRPGHRWVRPALERIAPLPPGDPDNLDAGEHPGFGSRGFVPQDYLARRRI